MSEARLHHGTNMVCASCPVQRGECPQCGTFWVVSDEFINVSFTLAEGAIGGEVYREFSVPVRGQLRRVPSVLASIRARRWSPVYEWTWERRDELIGFVPASPPQLPEVEP